MNTLTDEKTDSIIEQVRRMKEANAAKHKFDVRAIAAAAQVNQRKHPERMVTRIAANAEAHGDHPRTRSVSEDEL